MMVFDGTRKSPRERNRPPQKKRETQGRTGRSIEFQKRTLDGVASKGEGKENERQKRKKIKQGAQRAFRRAAEAFCVSRCVEGDGAGRRRGPRRRCPRVSCVRRNPPTVKKLGCLNVVVESWYVECARPSLKRPSNRTRNTGEKENDEAVGLGGARASNGHELVGRSRSLVSSVLFFTEENQRSFDNVGDGHRARKDLFALLFVHSSDRPRCRQRKPASRPGFHLSGCRFSSGSRSSPGRQGLPGGDAGRPDPPPDAPPASSTADGLLRGSAAARPRGPDARPAGPGKQSPPAGRGPGVRSGGGSPPQVVAAGPPCPSVPTGRLCESAPAGRLCESAPQAGPASPSPPVLRPVQGMPPSRLRSEFLATDQTRRACTHQRPRGKPPKTLRSPTPSHGESLKRSFISGPTHGSK